MLGIKGVILESAPKFFSKKNQNKTSWEFRLSNSDDSHTSHPQIISSYKVFSLSLKEEKVIDTEEISHCFPFPGKGHEVICILLCGTFSGILYYTAVWTTERHKISPTTAAMRVRKREE